eukprot:CAMPEP_0196787322 /NCGR_PEP_ID=MMETSP1104-20130614/22959_1 /TAXON_ID=33652 /ORGANISM="Cafeteria sp., Strain Caron Lab Isolate" /LENGTH=43 /DNA_ID= /DNA_START= /DNA_END= /DNA_ORIENTATION=
MNGVGPLAHCCLTLLALAVYASSLPSHATVSDSTIHQSLMRRA